MGKLIKFSSATVGKFANRKARTRSRKALKMEEKGQLNMFDSAEESKVIPFDRHSSDFDRAISLDETDPKAAEQLYWKCIKQDQYVSDAYCNLGILASAGGNLVKAADLFTKALENDPRHHEAHYNLANTYAEMGNQNLAKSHYRMAIEIKPEFPGSYYNLAIILAAEEDMDEALHFLGNFKHLSSEENEDADQLLLNIKRYLTLK